MAKSKNGHFRVLEPGDVGDLPLEGLGLVIQIEAPRRSGHLIVCKVQAADAAPATLDSMPSAR
jgi:hypothetical protein